MNPVWFTMSDATFVFEDPLMKPWMEEPFTYIEPVAFIISPAAVDEAEFSANSISELFTLRRTLFVKSPASVEEAELVDAFTSYWRQVTFA